MAEKAYCAIMDGTHLYVPISASSFATGMPVMFGGTVNSTDPTDTRHVRGPFVDHRVTLMDEVKEESQTQFTLTVGTTPLHADPAFVHGTDQTHPVCLYHAIIPYTDRNGTVHNDDYSSYLIDMTRVGAGATTVTITPGNRALPILHNATGWTAEQNGTGAYITLQTGAQLAAQGENQDGSMKNNRTLGTLFGLFSTPIERFNQLVINYTGASHILKIPRNAIRFTIPANQPVATPDQIDQATDQFLRVCDRILPQASRMLSNTAVHEWQDFYKPSFAALCALV